ncbi:MAG: Mut7-C RNAse domain-containing protein [Dehalococcoidia bacterium]
MRAGDVMEGGPRFIVDLNVGRLAKWLRAMGYDTLFLPGIEDGELIRLALRDGRIILTRDSLLLQRRVITSGMLRALLIRDDALMDQLRQVVRELGLDRSRDFSRCLRCNELLVSAQREAVQDRVPPYVFQTQREFMVCPACQRIYWRGTHWANMCTELAQVRGGAHGS